MNLKQPRMSVAKKKISSKKHRSPKAPENIWILDDSKSLLPLLKDAVGPVRFLFKVFGTQHELIDGLQRKSHGPAAPDLLVCEARVNNTHLPQLMSEFKPILPPVVVITNCNDGSLISACLEMGVKDYLLRPIERTMLGAKVTGHI